MRRWLVVVTLLGMAGAVTSRAAELAVAAASDLKYALDELVAEFRTNQPGTRVRVTYGSSGNFFAQLQNRAPFDLYLSADLDYPRRLAAAGHALDTNVFLYAIGRIVVWVPSSSSVDVEQMGVQSLVAPSVKKIAIANPRHAPYGRAAVEAMKSLRIYDHVEPQLVLGENTAQAAQFVQAGGADLGIIALSLALAPPLRSAGRFWEVPLEAYPRMEQGGVILRWTKEAGAARTFRDFVLGPRGRGVLKQYGFFPPEQ